MEGSGRALVPESVLTFHNGRPVAVVDVRWGSWTHDALIRYLDGNRERVIVHANEIEGPDA